MTAKPDGGTAGERIAKVIARRSPYSRRDAERLIADGRVTLAGQPVSQPARNVPPDAAIEIDGESLAGAAPIRLFRYYKPVGHVTTHRDPEGRPTVFDHLPPTLKDEVARLVSVGRLDINSEGLLLLTNDGGLARHLELPATGWRRRYRVRVHGRPDPDGLARLAGGVTIEGVSYGPIEARLEQRTGANAWLTVSLREGKNREVRRVMAQLGLEVNRLIRIAYGPFQIGRLKPGDAAEVPAKVLREQLGGVLKELGRSG